MAGKVFHAEKNRDALPKSVAIKKKRLKILEIQAMNCPAASRQGIKLESFLKNLQQAAGN